MNFLSTAGVIGGNEENLLRPKDNITRAEAAKMIAVYYLFDKKPTLITNGVSISYGGTFDYKEDAIPVINTDIIHDDINFYDNVTMADGEPETMYGTEELALGESDNSGITPKWCGDQHHNMTNQSLYILSEDNINNKTPKKITKLSGRTSSYKYSTTALAYMQQGSTAPDSDEQDYGMAKHYYHYGVDVNGKPNNSEGYTKAGKPANINARWGFNDHYYMARMEFNARNYANAYIELGRSIHYLQDTNAPHHAALKTNEETNNGHKNYEAWVKNNFLSSYWEFSVANSYEFMTNSTFLTLSNSFSKAACDAYSDCARFSTYPQLARPATAEQLKRTQRAVAGLLYRYLRDTGREF